MSRILEDLPSAQLGVTSRFLERHQGGFLKEHIERGFVSNILPRLDRQTYCPLYMRDNLLAFRLGGISSCVIRRDLVRAGQCLCKFEHDLELVQKETMISLAMTIASSIQPLAVAHLPEWFYDFSFVLRTARGCVCLLFLFLDFTCL